MQKVGHSLQFIVLQTSWARCNRFSWKQVHTSVSKRIQAAQATIPVSGRTTTQRETWNETMTSWHHDSSHCIMTVWWLVLLHWHSSCFWSWILELRHGQWSTAKFQAKRQRVSSCTRWSKCLSRQKNIEAILFYCCTSKERINKNTK